MQSNYRRITLQQRLSNMNRKILFLIILFAACATIPVAYLLIPCAITPSREPH
jgi:hypothetical protein